MEIKLDNIDSLVGARGTNKWNLIRDDFPLTKEQKGAVYATFGDILGVRTFYSEGNYTFHALLLPRKNPKVNSTKFVWQNKIFYHMISFPTLKDLLDFLKENPGSAYALRWAIPVDDKTIKKIISLTKAVKQ